MNERLGDLATAIFLACVFCWLICGPNRKRWERAVFIVSFTILAMGYRETVVWQNRLRGEWEQARIERQGFTDDEWLAWNCGFASAANHVAKPIDACGKFKRLFPK